MPKVVGEFIVVKFDTCCLTCLTTWNCKLASSVFCLFLQPNGFWFLEHSLEELLEFFVTGYIKFFLI